MNHTENYRLPQWEHSDRVLMEDFNQMCRNLDAGLTGAASENLRLDEKTCEMLRRAAYNQYHLSAAAGTFPRQMGAFHQGMDPLPADAKGFLQRDGFAWLAGGPEASSSDLRNALVQESPFSVFIGATLAQCKTLVLNFTAPGAMYLDYIQMQAPFRTGDQESHQIIQFTFKDLTTGTVVKEGQLTNTTPAGLIGDGTLTIRLQSYIKLGHQYRVEAKTLTTDYSVSYDLADGRTYVNAKGYSSQTGTLSYTLRESEESKMGLVFVRCAADSDDQCLSLRWDGVEYTPHKIHYSMWPDGKMYREAEYLRTGGIPKESELALSVDCGPTGEFALYEWGAILI